MKDYQTLNSQIIDSWCESGWQWGQPISHQQYLDALAGNWGVYLTPTKIVPKEWFGDLQGKQLLGLASGGGQQLPIFSALGAQCTLLDYSSRQCESDRMVAQREGYSIHISQGDMTQPFPFCRRELRPHLSSGIQLLCGKGGASLSGMLPRFEKRRHPAVRTGHRHQLPV